MRPKETSEREALSKKPTPNMIEPEDEEDWEDLYRKAYEEGEKYIYESLKDWDPSKDPHPKPYPYPPTGGDEDLAKELDDGQQVIRVPVGKVPRQVLRDAIVEYHTAMGDPSLPRTAPFCRRRDLCRQKHAHGRDGGSEQKRQGLHRCGQNPGRCSPNINN